MADKLKAKLQKTGVTINANLNRISYDHTILSGRDADDQHPISAITGLEDELADKATQDDIYPLKSAVENSGIGYYKKVSKFIDRTLVSGDWYVGYVTLGYVDFYLAYGWTYKVTIDGTETVLTCGYFEEDDVYGLCLDPQGAETRRYICSEYTGNEIEWYMWVFGDFEPPEQMYIKVEMSGETRAVFDETTIHPSDWESVWIAGCIIDTPEHQADFESNIIATVNGVQIESIISYIDWLDGWAFDLGNDLALYVGYESSELLSPTIPDCDITIKVDAVDEFALITSKISGDFIDGQSLSLPFATTSDYGITKLSSSVSNTAENVAATSSAVKQAYDKAVAADGARVTAGKKSGTSLGTYATAEGYNTTASGYSAHAEGYNTTASAYYSHAEGYGTSASGYYSHAEGCNTTARAYYSHAEGWNTTANKRSQHVFGEYNVADATGATDTRGSYIEIVGNGTGTSQRSNARTLDWDGNEVLAGKLTVGTAPSADMDVATKKYVDDNSSGLPSQSGKSGKFLSTDGSSAYWENLPIFVATYGTTDFVTLAAKAVGGSYVYAKRFSGNDYVFAPLSSFTLANGAYFEYGTGTGDVYYLKCDTNSNWSVVTCENVPTSRTINSKALSSDITLTASDVGALPDDTVIPTVPTDVSDFNNDAGYLTLATLPIYDGSVV